jgi:hypothetical protein
MRRPRASIDWETLLAAALFLLCTYATCAFIVIGALGWALFSLICAFGFFQALMGFLSAMDVRSRVLGQQGTEHIDS